MAVVINEFEVDATPEPPAAAASAAPLTAPQPGAQEIERVVSRLMERAERVRAH